MSGQASQPSPAASSPKYMLRMCRRWLFGSFAMGGFETRLIYWGVMMFGGYAIVRPALTARLELPELAVWSGLGRLPTIRNRTCRHAHRRKGQPRANEQHGQGR